MYMQGVRGLSKKIKGLPIIIILENVTDERDDSKRGPSLLFFFSFPPVFRCVLGMN